ncbi:serine palmitoyltransferase [Lactarius hengduanensis]|nr:serine palmitoyltransferase [Lactarius hengduanensis]
MSSLNDPGCTVLEILLALLQSRTRADNDEMHFMQFSEKEVDELVDESTSEPLGAPLTPEEQFDLALVLNLASYNFTGLAGNETINVRATETLRKFGVGSCGPPVFYDVHMDLERGFSRPQFCTPKDSRQYLAWFPPMQSVVTSLSLTGVSTLPFKKGLHISRSTVRWFDYNDLKSLEDVLLSVEKEHRKRRGPLTRRFIVTEDTIIGSVANGLNSSGGFCAGSRIVVDHQYINSTSFVFSAAVPAPLAVSASEGINILRNTPSILSMLQENVRAIRAVLDRVEAITIHLANHPHLPAFCGDAFCIHLRVCEAAEPCDPRAVRIAVVAGEERLLQDIVDEALAQGVWTTRARPPRGKERSRRARASGEPSRLRCRARSASALLVSSRQPS